MTSVENPWLTGNVGPVSEEVTATDLAVTGTIPSELDGRYLRNGPNPIDPVDPATYHWFTGTGMVHGVRLRDGRAEWYRNRYVRNPELATRLGEELPNPYPPEVMVFSANTNVIGHAGRTLALVEAGSPPIELSDELESIGVCDFSGTLEHPFSAHPKRDPRTGDLHVAAYYWGWGDRIRYLVVDAQGRVRRNVDVDLPAAGSPMVHDIAITERFAVLFDFPVTFDLEVAMTGEGLPYRWDPDHGARVGLLGRDDEGSDVEWFDVEPCYVFHPLNAYDVVVDGVVTQVVLDVVRHPKVFASEVRGPNEGATRLERWTFERSAHKVITETLCDRSLEFPRLDERVQSLEHRFGYSAALAWPADFGPALKHDLVAGTTEVRDFGPARSTGEPIFVPSTPESDEDDGYCMALVYDASTDRSDLEIWHAQDFTGDAIARVHLPQRVPVGFHGNWVPTP